MNEKLKILYMAAEAVPFIKAGGLGDVAGSLPKAIKGISKSIDIRLVLPFHNEIKDQGLDLRPVVKMSIDHHDGPIPAEVLLTEFEGFPIYFVSGTPISSSKSIYSERSLEDGYKYAFFSLAVLELAKALNWQPDILHANDWHTAIAVYALKLKRKQDVFFTNTKSLLTIHNLPYLGNEAGPALSGFGLPPVVEPSLPDWSRNMPLPMGLWAADKINTVSVEYANEILTEEFGSGLYQYLQTRKDDISGILNGLDQESWDPSSDPNLWADFSNQTLTNRKENKLKLQDEIGFAVSQRIPLLSIVSRLNYQKGIDLAIQTLRNLTDHPWRVVILGTGDEELENQIKQFQQDYPDKVKAHNHFDERFSRKIFAGADAILIPSRYEPCGLTQMIGMRYGCVPIARATGGLRDTIVDYHQSEGSTGFLFKDATPEALANAVERALEVYSDQRRWRGLQLRGMRKDFSWTRSAHKYIDLYQTISTEI